VRGSPLPNSSIVLPLLAALLFAPAACGSSAPVLPGSSARDLPAVSIMSASQLSAAELTSWFQGRTPQPGGVYSATVPVSELAAYFIEEGNAEGVSGDVAFMQAIVETGWFRFGGRVDARANNFAGIGAHDRNEPAQFPDARAGVRAQIQHLRAYADPKATVCAVPPLRRPCADPRFHLVLPRGKAPRWNDLGGGNWAESRGYAASILSLYDEARAFSRRR
jgi:Mannosyl-glycoprotein endo-beta-N-acetylglucosaminidase